jgi:hypothetical protein
MGKYTRWEEAFRRENSGIHSLHNRPKYIFQNKENPQQRRKECKPAGAVVTIRDTKDKLQPTPPREWIPCLEGPALRGWRVAHGFTVKTVASLGSRACLRPKVGTSVHFFCLFGLVPRTKDIVGSHFLVSFCFTCLI